MTVQPGRLGACIGREPWPSRRRRARRRGTPTGQCPRRTRPRRHRRGSGRPAPLGVSSPVVSKQAGLLRGRRGRCRGAGSFRRSRVQSVRSSASSRSALPELHDCTPAALERLLEKAREIHAQEAGARDGRRGLPLWPSCLPFSMSGGIQNTSCIGGQGPLNPAVPGAALVMSAARAGGECRGFRSFQLRCLLWCSRPLRF